MAQKFFTTNDDFKAIITRNLPKVNNIHQIETGWTNFVFKVNSDGKIFYFRFPRNDFFSDALVKEVKVTEFVKDKISLETPNLNLLFDAGRPYTMHEEIPGESLTNCYADLTIEEKLTLADDICLLLKQFENISIAGKKNLQLVSNFLDNLAGVSQNNYDLKKHDAIKRCEKEKMVFSHGDFNQGNLILRNHKLVAVIDFSFAGISSGLVDVSRIAGRCPAEFKPILLAAYSKILRSVEQSDFDEIEQAWNYVDSQYILYIKQNHPEIKLSSIA